MTKILSANNIFLSIILNGSLQQLWGLIRSSQLLMNSSMIAYPYPANMVAFLTLFSLFANLDVLRGGDIAENMDMIQTDSYNDLFKLFGVDTQNFLSNTGSIILMMMFLILEKIIASILLYVAKKNY